MIIRAISKFILKRYARDMGNYFDHIKDNEEELTNEIEGILRYGKIKEKIIILKGVV